MNLTADFVCILSSASGRPFYQQGRNMHCSFLLPHVMKGSGRKISEIHVLSDHAKVPVEKKLL